MIFWLVGVVVDYFRLCVFQLKQLSQLIKKKMNMNNDIPIVFPSYLGSDDGPYTKEFLLERNKQIVKGKKWRFHPLFFYYSLELELGRRELKRLKKEEEEEN